MNRLRSMKYLMSSYLLAALVISMTSAGFLSYTSTGAIEQGFSKFFIPVASATSEGDGGGDAGGDTGGGDEGQGSEGGDSSSGDANDEVGEPDTAMQPQGETPPETTVQPRTDRTS